MKPKSNPSNPGRWALAAGATTAIARLEKTAQRLCAAIRWSSDKTAARARLASVRRRLAALYATASALPRLHPAHPAVAVPTPHHVKPARLRRLGSRGAPSPAVPMLLSAAPLNSNGPALTRPIPVPHLPLISNVK